MGTYSDDQYPQDNARREPSEAAQRAASRAAENRPKTGARGTVSTRPSRDSILQNYAAEGAQRARNARMYSQAVSQVYQESAARSSDRAAQRQALLEQQREQRAAWEAQRAAEREARRAAEATHRANNAARSGRPRARVVPPLSSQESYDRTRSSMESYERARASRDALSDARRSRTLNREVIDGRGSIDSRAFNETHELVGYSIDERDKPEAAVDASFHQTRWHSRAGQGFSDVPDSGAKRPGPARSSQRTSNVGFSGGVMSGRANYTAPRKGLLGLIAELPLFAKIALPVIIVLIVVLIVLLTR